MCLLGTQLKESDDGSHVTQCVCLLGTQLKESDDGSNVTQCVLMGHSGFNVKQCVLMGQLKETMYAKCETMRVNGTAEEVRRRKQR